MAYLIDTDLVIYHLNDVAAAEQLVDQLFDAGVAMSAITYAEVLEGLRLGVDPARAQHRFDAIALQVPVVAFGEAEAEHAAQIRAELRQRGRRVRSRALDLLIAATARANDLTLVTNNPADYNDIPDLRLQAASISSD